MTSPQGRESTAQESLRDLADPQTDGVLRTDHWHAPCWRAEGEPTREPLGEEFPSSYPLLLSPDLPLAEVGLPAEVWAVPRAQICTGLSMTVGTEQSWRAQELWLGTYTQPWVCPLSSPLPLPHPCGEMKTWSECLCPRSTSPHLAAYLDLGVPVMISQGRT